MTAAAFKNWINQPSTITGLGTFCATVSGLVAHVITHDTTESAAAAAAAFALIHVILPDNSAAASSVEKLVTDAVTAAASKKLSDALPMLIQDGMAVVSAMSTQTAPTTVTVSVPAQPVAAATKIELSAPV